MKSGFLGLSATAALLVGLALPAQATTFDLSANPPAPGDFGAAGNKGASSSATIGGLTLTLTAMSNVLVTDASLNTGNAAKNGGSTAGTVYIDTYGAGVQNAGAGGSKGISGDGADDDEALVLTFSQAMDTSTFSLKLIDFDGSATGDLIHLYFDTKNAETSTDLLISNAVGSTALSCAGATSCTLNFSALAGLPASFTRLYVRAGYPEGAASSHFEISGVTGSAVPEPTSLLLLSSGLIGMAARRRSRKDS